MALLRTAALTVRFGGIAALDGVGIAVQDKEIVGLLGPNGAGKSTLFNALSGFIRPDHGAIFYDEEEIHHLLPYERVALGIGRTFQRVRLFRRLTVYENLLVAQHRHINAGAFAAMLRLPWAQRLGNPNWRIARSFHLSSATATALKAPERPQSRPRRVLKESGACLT